MTGRPCQRTGAAFLVLACFLFLWPGAATISFAQVSAAGGWSTTTETYPPPHANRKKTVFSGLEANPQPDGTLLIKQLKIETFRENGDGEMVFEAPDCVLDQRTHAAGSPGPLQIHSADGKLRIAGTGFLWRQAATNSSLTISNNIETTLQRELLAQSTAAPGSATNPPSGTNQLVYIHSDEFFYDRNANTIIYRQNVHVEDDQMVLTCDVLTIQRATNGAIENITADRNVVIINKGAGGRAGGRTTGDHAVYTAAGDVQLVTLTGNPHWQDGASEGTARTFVFDRTHNTLQAVGDAYLKLPRDAVGDPGFMLTTQPVTATNAPGDVTNFVEISSDRMTFQLPPTNGPVISITAETNVKILDPEKQSQASADRALYIAATGALELTGKATWEAEAGRQAARGEFLAFDRNNRSFTARTNAFLRYPVDALGPSTAIGGPRSTNTAASTNQFIEVFADSYDYQNDSLVFHGPVKAGLLDGGTTIGTLDCGALTVGFTSNKLQSVVADTDVYARQLPAAKASGKTVEKDLRCDHLQVQMRTNGLVRDITALRNVTISQTETGTNTAKPVVITMTSGTLTAFFQPNTNVVDNIVAERNVVITREDGTARGAKVVYTATDNLARLTGDPIMESAQGWLTAEDSIVYDRATGRTKAIGNPDFKSKPGALVKTNLPSAPEPSVR